MEFYFGVTEGGFIMTKPYKTLKECKQICDKYVGLRPTKFQSVPVCENDLESDVKEK